jgi:hypothetical protein
MIVDPSKVGDFRSCGRGDKVLALTGFTKNKSNGGNEQYEVHWVCVKDLAAPEDDDGDKGADHWDRLSLSEAAAPFIARLMKAAGYNQSFDTLDKDLIADTLANSFVIATVFMDNYNGEQRPKTKSWRPYTGAEGEDWQEIIKKGEENHKKLVAKRAAGAGAKGGSGGGGGTGGTKRKAVDDDPTGAGAGGAENDEGILF